MKRLTGLSKCLNRPRPIQVHLQYLLNSLFLVLENDLINLSKDKSVTFALLS